LPPEWRVVRLGDVCTVRGGYAFPPSHQGSVAGDVPFYKVSDMNLPGNWRDLKNANNYVDRSAIQKLKVKLYPAGTVAIPRRGGAVLTNKKRILTREAVLDNNLMGIWVADRKQCDAQFLYYWFASKDLGHFSNPGPLPAVNDHRVRAELMSLPPLTEQREIAHVLWRIQRAKEATEAVIAATRELKRSLMRHLFTYGPVPVDQVAGIRLKETEFGPVRDDWQVIRMGDASRLLQYGTPQRCNTDPVGVPVLRIPNVLAGRVDTADLKFAELPAVTTEKLRLRFGDILFVRTNGAIGEVGRAAIYRGIPAPALFASYLIRVQVNEHEVMPEYVEAYAASPEARRQLRDRASKSADGKYNINTQTLRALILPQPSLDEQARIVAALLAVDLKLEAERHRSTTLHALFNTLLDRLMGGALRVNPSPILHG
jgi:type I restriction enzyme, S subunit